MNEEIIYKYFPNLNDTQKEQFKALYELYLEWNAKINVISRKDIDNLYEHHILHSLAIAKFISFTPGTKIMDLGTGGGFPGIPLAIMYPDVEFLLNDRINKKLTVGREVAQAIGLKNVSFRHCGAEEIKEKFDFVVSRAVMPLPDLIKIIRKNISKEQHNGIPNGLICLKGGDLIQELAPYRRVAIIEDIKDYFTEAFFETKNVIYVPL
ncbi:MAG: 16S rRNA (guanine(527)-N(7))-methyltransferase RsmG [Bacteroidales bacterium]